MLLQLNISNFALIENLSISFERGFNVLSGETGAGKSILIDAINYVLGGKFNKDFIRTGENRTYVEAVFTIENIKTQEILESYQIDYEDMVIISRETFQYGKSIAKVNGKTILLTNLKLITNSLIDIHGQHENQNLLDSTNHIYYIDSFCGEQMDSMLSEYKAEFEKLKRIENRIIELEGQGEDRNKLIDFLKFQIDEINAAKLRIDEETEMESKFSMLSNAEKISSVLSECYEVLYEGSDSSLPVNDLIGTVVKELKSIESHVDKIKEISNSLEEVYYGIHEYADEIRKIKDNIYYDQNELDYINNRLYQIGNLKKKYGESIMEILSYRDKIQLQYNEMANRTEIIESLRNEDSKIRTALVKKAEELHEIRCKYSNDLGLKVKNELSYIGMDKSVFKIIVEKEKTLSNIGLDKVQFYISTNPGEPLKPLDKIVSGGELSRIMLALKTVFVDKDEIPTVIFDEIDTGISGRVAQSVGEKMYQVSMKRQVFCVTHLPQIACMSDMHYMVSKMVKDDKTFTNIHKLSREEKEYEIARMIGGSEVTKLTLEHAKELIRLWNEKNELKKINVEK